MPELPEVETTVRGLRKKVLNLSILDVWTDLKTKDPRKKDTVADPKYFPVFKKEIKNKKIISVERVAKNILINLSGSPAKTILIHMKLTGYLFYGKDPKIKFAHVIFSLSNKHYLVFSDMRKFGKITLLDTKEAHETKHLKGIGPDPLSKEFTLEKLKEVLNKKPNGKIKTVLLDQSIIAGIGNIYSDEILWYAGIHPERKISQIKPEEFKKLHKFIKEVLQKGINFGGDSMSDYRNINGLPGEFQLQHQAYQRTGEKCRKKGCGGVIIRKVINNRSAHFCAKHQK
ncbi:MAG TPA: DNA-formamidopyrimidine glycosylase [Candidatus Paceibacterota bacterium]|nr:DNA-formamidopyrimidine glycosylase [Candidatus Paceibacterota bacterium]